MAISLKKVEKWAQKKKVDKLLKALSCDDREIRVAVIKALGDSKNESAMHTLISLLKDPDVSVRIAVLEALGTMSNGRSLEFIKQLWNNESDENVKEKAKWAINEIKKNMVTEDKL